MLTQPNLILGSSSPRRGEILGYLNLPFKQVASDFDEETIRFKGDPAEYVCTLARLKGEILSKTYLTEIIITADTTVYSNGAILNKPKNFEAAKEMLYQLQGSEHTVVTGVAVHYKGKVAVESMQTKVHLVPMNHEQIDVYHKQIFPLDKAGGYTVQGFGSLIVNKIDGCFYNVLGLPLTLLQKLLAQLDWDLWNLVSH